MASRSEERERKTTEFSNFESSRSDTATALLRKRRFTRVMPARHFLHFTLARLVQLCKYCFFSVCTMSTYSARQSSKRPSSMALQQGSSHFCCKRGYCSSGASQ